MLVCVIDGNSGHISAGIIVSANSDPPTLGVIRVAIATLKRNESSLIVMNQKST